jgi:hypothetical protein
MEKAPESSDPSVRLALMEKVPTPAKYASIFEASDRPLIELEELESTLK